MEKYKELNKSKVKCIKNKFNTGAVNKNIDKYNHLKYKQIKVNIKIRN